MKTAIVITAAHADTVTIGIETDEWDKDDIEMPHVDRIFVQRFERSVLALRDPALRAKRAELHFSWRADHRRENPLFCAPTARNDFFCIDLVPHR